MCPDPSKLAVLRSLPLLYRFIHHSIGGSDVSGQWSDVSGQFTTTSAEVTPNGFKWWFSKGIPQNGLKLG